MNDNFDTSSPDAESPTGSTIQTEAGEGTAPHRTLEMSSQSVETVQKPAELSDSTKTGSSAFRVLLLLVLLAVLVGMLFILDFGKGPLLSFNRNYTEIGYVTPASRVPNAQPAAISQTVAPKPISYQHNCPSDQVKLTTDSTTLNGPSVSCWPNTVYETSKVKSVDTTIPLKSVFCPTGKGKVQSGETGPPTLTVSCK